MPVKEILQLGNPKLHEISAPVDANEMDALKSVITDLHDTLMDFREKHNHGIAITAPQINIMKRVVYMHIDKPVVFINPEIEEVDCETIEDWDDCMSFPDLLVKVKRYKKIRVNYKDINWQSQSRLLDDEMSRLLQHECDHLDGVMENTRLHP